MIRLRFGMVRSLITSSSEETDCLTEGVPCFGNISANWVLQLVQALQPDHCQGWIRLRTKGQDHADVDQCAWICLGDRSLQRSVRQRLQSPKNSRVWKISLKLSLSGACTFIS